VICDKNIKWYHKFDESYNLIRSIKSCNLKIGSKVLDIGCGFGDVLRILKRSGIIGVGIDINENIVRQNKEDKLCCLTVKEFEKYIEENKEYINDLGEFDIIIMKHIIEHFSPEKLIEFIDHYLQFLKINGYLLILTPYNWVNFYHDFDHIKSYYPQSINQILCEENPQIQYVSKYKCKLVNIRIRRHSKKLSYGTKLYLELYHKNLKNIIEKLYSILFILSRGLIGTTTGWIGVYQNLGLKTQEINNE